MIEKTVLVSLLKDSATIATLMSMTEEMMAGVVATEVVEIVIATTVVIR